MQIKDYLRLNIQNGVFAVNERIPSERQLAEQFSVNRLSVSKALSELTQKRLVYSRVGKGTYVSPPKIDQALQSLTSFTDDISSRGKKASSQVSYASGDPAANEVAKALSILPGAEVMVLHRVRMADMLLVALELRILSMRCVLAFWINTISAGSRCTGCCAKNTVCG